MIHLSNLKYFNPVLKAIFLSLDKLQKEIYTEQIEEFINVLINTFHLEKKILLYGAGRSLLVGKTFSMRLMQLGYESYVIDEVVTPAIEKNDVFLVISKTFSSKMGSVAVDVAKKLKAKIIIITSVRDSYKLKKRADHLIFVPHLPISTIQTLKAPIPLGTLFEISTMILLDCIVTELMDRLGITEEDMKRRHLNIR